MSPVELLERAKDRLSELSPERLRVADDFLAYLADRETDEATEELLALPGFLEDLRQAEEDIAAGRLTPVDGLRRKT